MLKETVRLLNTFKNRRVKHLFFSLFVSIFIFTGCQQESVNNTILTNNDEANLIAEHLLKEFNLNNTEKTESSVFSDEKVLNSQALHQRCSSLPYQVHTSIRAYHIYYVTGNARDLGFSNGLYTITQRISRPSRSALLGLVVLRRHSNGRSTTLGRDSTRRNSSNDLSVTANIYENDNLIIGVISKESWGSERNFGPLEISGNCQTQIQDLEPTISYVTPKNPRLKMSLDQTITIRGENIERDASAVFYSPDNNHIIVRARDLGKHQHISSNELRVQVRFKVPGHYTVQLFNQPINGEDRPSNGFEIIVPDIPQSDGFVYPFTNPSSWYNAQGLNAYYSGYGYHLGEDWNLKTGGNSDCGESIYASSDGKVVYGGYPHSQWGGVVIVRSFIASENQEREVLYGHIRRKVNKGELVRRGEVIGELYDIDGNNGKFYCHLHIELRDNRVGHWWGQPGPAYFKTQKAHPDSGWTAFKAWMLNHQP